MFTKVLVANRGAIACRIIRTLRRLGVASVAVYSEADVASLHVRAADEAICIGPGPALQSYLRIDAILEAAQRSGAEAIHPGYGFLSENADFVDACDRAGIVFIGPSAAQMRTFGLKHAARALALAEGVPLLPGSGLLANAAAALEAAERIGYPVMLKSTAGGGGIGMRRVESAADLEEAYASVARLAAGNFKDAGIFLEKFVAEARHIEVQVFGDGAGNVIALSERDCSLQRRNQKVLEETPAPGLDPGTRAALFETAARLARAASYRSAGTVEFVYDVAAEAFYFLEVNTRLQVEHGITEAVHGVDLVEWMVLLAAGQLAPLATLAPPARGAAIEVRLYAENPLADFQPSTGVLTEAVFPEDARVERWVERGTEVSFFYDPMLAKLIVHGSDRRDALAKLGSALAATRLGGVETNLDYLRQVTADAAFVAGGVDTGFLGRFEYRPRVAEVLAAGLQTTVQDWPGRLGYWNVGVPPSGPMDAFSHRLANRLVGNAGDAAALECTVSGPVLKFHVATVVAVTGAKAPVTIDGRAVAMHEAHAIERGGVLEVGTVEDAGARIYIAVAGGIDVPDYLGSRATFTLGRFGGVVGRSLRVGDLLHLAQPEAGVAGVALAAASVPVFSHHWDVGVLYGPHGAPDFFLDEDIETFFGTDWKVHYNSSRTGVRLVGPKPRWAREDGGEAGLHPSNIHDNAYAIGAVDFTGDMPVVLGPDGPSLGGFVCPAVVVAAELWKLGQLRSGDTVRFHRVSLADAAAREAALEAVLATLAGPLPASLHDDPAACPSPVLATRPAGPSSPAVVVRQAGDRYVLVEFGPPVLDVELRLSVHALMHALEARQVSGIVDLTPGIRSLQVHFDPAVLPRASLLELLDATAALLPALEDVVVPSRIVHLPLAWDDGQTRLAIEKYMQSVRADAPWCPSNLEFVRRMNGLDSVEDVRALFFAASYLVLGLGDVYLGAPVATPIDPRQRLVTTKYNPARTWTPENAVGIGGAYLCVYGMEGPGGYQLLGRTIQMWNRWRHGAGEAVFTQPWLLRFFDELRFFPVTEEELARMRVDFPLGRLPLAIEETTFSLRDHRAFLEREAASISAFKTRQQAAFDAERERWHASGTGEYDDAGDEPATGDVAADLGALPPGAVAVTSPVQGNVWKLFVKAGDEVARDQVVLVVESMKMEFPLVARVAGRVVNVEAREGASVGAGQEVLRIQTATQDHANEPAASEAASDAPGSASGEAAP